MKLPLCLIINNDPKIFSALRKVISPNQVEILAAKTVEKALELLQANEPDMIIVQWNFTESELRALSPYFMAQSNILAIGSNEQHESVKKWLSINTHFIHTPISILALKEALAELHQRASHGTGQQLVLRYNEDQLYLNHKKINLTPTERRFIEILVSAPLQIFSRTQLLKQVWSDKDRPQNSRAVDSHMRRIRDEFSRYGYQDLIQTVHNEGYRLAI